MRTKKIRGHNRRQRSIDKWRLENLSLDLCDYLENEQGRFCVKIRIHPWSGLSLTDSVIPEPNGKTKQQILNGLFEIYDNWKIQLDTLGKPYYLKIWLFEPRFSQSQVVCAIGDKVKFYENTFFKPSLNKILNIERYGYLKNKLNKMNWDYRFDEYQFDYSEVKNQESYFSKSLFKKPHRTEKIKEPVDDIIEVYSFKIGDVWLGEKNAL